MLKATLTVLLLAGLPWIAAAQNETSNPEPGPAAAAPSRAQAKPQARLKPLAPLRVEADSGIPAASGPARHNAAAPRKPILQFNPPKAETAP